VGGGLGGLVGGGFFFGGGGGGKDGGWVGALPFKLWRWDKDWRRMRLGCVGV